MPSGGSPKVNPARELGFEAKLWAAADKLRGNVDAGEYKHVVLGLIFLKYVSDAFQERYAAFQADEYADPEDKGVLPKEYARPGLDQDRLGGLIDLIGTIGLGDAENRSKDVLGRVYEYFLGQLPRLRGARVASSTRRAARCGCWSRCWRRMRALAFTIHAAARAACSE